MSPSRIVLTAYHLETILIIILIFGASCIVNAALVSNVAFVVHKFNLKTGKSSSFHKIWVNRSSTRVEEYSHDGTILKTILLSDGAHSYMYIPRTKNASNFSGISVVSNTFLDFVTEDNLTGKYGSAAKKMGEATVDGISCHVYKVGGITVIEV